MSEKNNFIYKKSDSLKRCCIFLMLTFSFFISNSQDIHFSQFLKSPLNLNPAYTGYFDGDYRFGGNHRNQWKSVTVPYKTFSGYFDMNKAVPNSDKARIGTGIIFNTDKAGDSEYSITEAGISPSFITAIGNDSMHFVSTGIQISYHQQSINVNKLTFDNQFNGDIYDPSLPSNEVFVNSKLTFIDFSLGASYLFRSSEQFSIGGGVGLFHLFEPSLNFFNVKDSAGNDISDSKVKRKASADVRSNIGLTENIFLQPALLFSTQHKFSELNLGANLKFLLNHKPGRIINLYAGMFLRTKDALIPVIGLDYNELNIGVSYDINTSDLNRASNRRGGYEISLTYIIKKVKPSGIHPPCPVY